ncbi:hypothetical protein ACJQWK_08973 [Exserohilum turcicum]
MIRDPHFWNRFSIAVHQDEMEKQLMSAQGPKHSDSWLVRQKKKERHRTWLCWAFWMVFMLLVAGIVATILILKSRKII